MNTYDVDLLVIGAGVAGLRAAWQGIKNQCRTAIVYIGNGASPNILAFNSPRVGDESEDSCEIYYEDMMRSGRYLNNTKLVKNLSLASIELIESLKEIGYEPEKDEKGAYLTRHLGGCSYPRSVFSKDSTGGDIVNALWHALRVKEVIEIPDVKILMPVIEERRLIGAIGVHMKTKEIVYIRAKSTVLASGGIGSLYKGSTYPKDVKGSSLIFALLAGAKLIDMEFVQFEPTVCFTHPLIDRMEIPTAMMGDGAYLRNKDGERFILKYGFNSETGVEKAFMAKCIFREIKEKRGSKNGGVYFDARHVPKETLEKYVLRVNRLKQAGIDLGKDMVEVRPAAHSHMGGVVIDENCFTDVPGLLVAGEAAGGIHGASRIAGNSGTDALVFGDRAGYFAAKSVKNNQHPVSDKDWENALCSAKRKMREIAVTVPDHLDDIADVTGELLAKYCGIERQGSELDFALTELYKLKNKMKVINSENNDELITGLDNFKDIVITEIILMAALLRQESRGAHVRVDFPEERGHFEKSILHELSENNRLQHFIRKVE